MTKLIESDRSMSPFLDAFSRQHFASQPRDNLLVGLRRELQRGSIEQILDAIASDDRPVQRMAFAILRSRSSELNHSHLTVTVEDVENRAAVLRAFGAISDFQFQDAALEARLLSIVGTGSRSVARAAAEYLVRRSNRSIEQVVRLFEQTDDTAIGRVLCLHAPQQACFSLATSYLRQRARVGSGPSYVGVALTPTRLCNLNVPESDIAILSADFGYTSESSQFSPDALAGQLWYCDESIFDTAEATRRVDEVSWYLIGRACAGETTGVPSFDPDSETERALLIAAVRRLDSENVQRRVQASPFEFPDPLQGILRFAHSPSRLVAKALFDEPLSNFESAGWPSELKSQYLLDHASIAVNPDEERRTEAALFLQARYEVANETGDVPIEVITDAGSKRLAEARSLVEPPTIGSPLDAIEELSPGARAARKWLHVFDGCDIGSRLRTDEVAFRDYLVPIGIEVQIPTVPLRKHIAWKESLRNAGIPSPRRPECRTMLEAAFPPSATSLAPTLFLESIGRVGLVDSEQDLGLHVSFQGDLGPQVRYLAFVQMLLNTPIDRSEKPRTGQSLVMSKGLVCLNDDVTRCHWNPIGNTRTELRTFLLAARSMQSGGLEPDPGTIRSVVETHLLASSLLSDNDSLRRPFTQFQSLVRKIMTSAPPAFTALLDANFYESTGDYRDGEMLTALPIMRLLDDVREHRSDRTLMKSLRDQLRIARADSAKLFAREVGIQLPSDVATR